MISYGSLYSCVNRGLGAKFGKGVDDEVKESKIESVWIFMIVYIEMMPKFFVMGLVEDYTMN